MFYFPNIFTYFATVMTVERFVLIATTGKNAKTVYPFFSVNQTSRFLFN